MNPLKGLAAALIIAGILVLAYGGFSYAKEDHVAQIGSLKVSVRDERHVSVPLWAGVGAIVIGAALLLVPLKKQ